MAYVNTRISEVVPFGPVDRRSFPQPKQLPYKLQWSSLMIVKGIRWGAATGGERHGDGGEIEATPPNKILNRLKTPKEDKP